MIQEGYIHVGNLQTCVRAEGGIGGGVVDGLVGWVGPYWDCTYNLEGYVDAWLDQKYKRVKKEREEVVDKHQRQRNFFFFFTSKIKIYMASERVQIECKPWSIRRCRAIKY